MSRNLELLQQAEQARAAENVSAAAVAPAVVLGDKRATATLRIDDVARQEIGKVVHQLALLPESRRVLTFSAIAPGSGCSWVISRVAETLATQLPGTVCLVDANLRTPSLHTCFGMDNHHGLSDALAASSSLTNFMHQLQPNLWIVTCGSLCEQGEVLLKSEMLGVHVAELRTQFDWVLVDASSLGVGCDALSVARRTDGVIVVIEANATNREAARKALEELSAAGVQVLGAVLNQRRFPIPQRLYKHL